MRKLSKTEMNTIKGGNAHLPMNSKYRSKVQCTAEAHSLIFRGIVGGMTEEQIAKEIFAHAVAYYAAPTLASIPLVGDNIKAYLISHASVIDIMDGGDTLARQVAYNAIWAFCGDQV